MRVRGLSFALIGVAALLGGCMQSTIEPASEANLTLRDKKLLAAAPYENAVIPEPYRRHIVDYHRKEAPGSIVVDSDNHYLYYVMDGGKARRGCCHPNDQLAVIRLCTEFIAPARLSCSSAVSRSSANRKSRSSSSTMWCCIRS